ncbi:protein phosphatase 1 regulatory subunit 42-like [Contarinia nasturtii]|uniref:protein phosphatase 1 regulatory subunit 42-like n=1 Tax=Contarinia nasturtii TaxID=265458 RepID=UPI0012D41C73|nr:protein phosphatase 1 regulatory subunit 42-like [Contarinia nasturtii]
MSNTFVERFCHKIFQKNPKKSKDEIIKKLTHLYLNGRKLEEIGELTCEQLKVLYLHNNSIQKIANLDQLHHLTHLYLQWNRIRKIENINHLQNLRKLYLSYNEIECLDGVDNLNLLEELHLEYQNLQSQHEFTFGVNSLIGISASLRILNISGLRLNELKLLKTLPHLEELSAADNNFDNGDYIARSIEHLGYLTKAIFTNCPAQMNDIYYRNKVILASKSLEILDSRMVNDVTRSFLKSFDKVKTEHKQKLANTNNNAKIVDIDLREDLPSIHSEGRTFDVTNIISQAIVENMQNEPWALIQD